MKKEPEFSVEINITLPDADGVYREDPTFIYTRQGDTAEDVRNIEDLLFQAIEVESLDDITLFVQQFIDRDGVFFDYDEALVTPRITRTNQPSELIIWGDREPNIFAIDRAKSNLEVDEDF